MPCSFAAADWCLAATPASCSRLASGEIGQRRRSAATRFRFPRWTSGRVEGVIDTAPNLHDFQHHHRHEPRRHHQGRPRHAHALRHQRQHLHRPDDHYAGRAERAEKRRPGQPAAANERANRDASPMPSAAPSRSLSTARSTAWHRLQRSGRHRAKRPARRCPRSAAGNRDRHRIPTPTPTPARYTITFGGTLAGIRQPSFR